MPTEHITLTDYYCTECKQLVYIVSGFWECDCYKVGAYELDIGFHELPKFWEKTDKEE